LTLYVESNFLLEIVLGQEDSAPAEQLLAMAEAKTIDLALPSFSLSEPLVRIRRGVRDRSRLMKQLNDQVTQLARSTPHKIEVGALRAIPNLFATIEQRETDRLISTVEQLLATARLIELASSSFRAAMDYRPRYALEIEAAIIFALVVADLKSQPGAGPHLFANRNIKDFDDPLIIKELKELNCGVVWSFTDALDQLGSRGAEGRVEKRF
jgi:hypothetical protein